MRQDTPEKIHNKFLKYFPFCTISIIMLLLCLKGGFFGFIGAKPFELSRITLPSGLFIILFSFTWLLCLILLLLFPRGLTDSQSRLLILSLALISRLALLPHEPSDDINRYLWEGRLVSKGINPYLYAPDDPFLEKYAKDDLFYSSVNHPDHPAIYPPFMLFLFSLIVRISYSPIIIKLLMITADMGTIWCITLLISHRCLDLRWSILYAFNPVILYAFAGQAHLDVIQNFFFLCALCFYDQKKWILMFLFAGLAVQTKYVSVLALPFLVNKENIKFLIILILSIFTPFLLIPDQPTQAIYNLLNFGTQFAFNGPVHGLLRIFFGGIGPATSICKFLLLSVLIFGYIYFHPQRSPKFQDDPVSGSFFVMGALLLLSPTVHFWYLSWIIPFLALRPFASWTILCLTVSAYFITSGILHFTGRWHLPVWAQALEWLPFFLLFIRDCQLFYSRFSIKTLDNTPKSVSVIIPVKNESVHIEACIKSVKNDPAVKEIIVVDGGSSDNTACIAKKAGANVIFHNMPVDKGGGRGGQIHAGIMAARCDVIAIVHGDTCITFPVFTRMIDLLCKNPAIAGGAVGGHFKGSGWRLGLLEFANDLRAAFLGISFGDQVQFFRREIAVSGKLFPNIPLMEDVELSLRLHHIGRSSYMFGNALISDRKWKAKVLKRSSLIIFLFISYLWNRLWKKVDTAEMYRQYYR